jgi:hypothetical protein
MTVTMEESTTCKHGHEWAEHGVLHKGGSRHCRECHRLCQEAKAHPQPVYSDEHRAAKLAEFDAAMRKRYPRLWKPYARS